MVLAPSPQINWCNDDDVVFNGPRIGVKRLHDIVKNKLEKHSMIRGNTKAGASANVLKRLFKQFDKDNSGTIDQQEFFALLKQVGLQNINKADATELFAKYDSDKSGGLDFHEWCHIYGVATHISHNAGIIDLPSSKNDVILSSKSYQERLFLLRKDFAQKLRQNQVSATAVFTECAGSATARVNRDRLKTIIRGKYCIGIGNDNAMDTLLDSVCVGGMVNFTAFQKAFCSVLPNQKFRETNRPLFCGNRIGVERLHKLVCVKMHKNTFRRGVVKAVSSPHVLKGLFKQFDKDNSGTIDYEEFKVMVSEQLGITTVHETDVKGLFQKYDDDGNGSLDYNEFANLFCEQFSTEQGIIDLPSTKQDTKHARMTPKQAQMQLSIDVIRICTERQITTQQLFQQCCKGNNTTTCSKQIKLVLRGKFGIGIGNEASLDRAVSSAASNGGGSINFEQFADALQLRTDMAKKIQTRQHERRRSSQNARGLGGVNPYADAAINLNSARPEQASGPTSAEPASNEAIDWSDVLGKDVEHGQPAVQISELQRPTTSHRVQVCHTERAPTHLLPFQDRAQVCKTERSRPSSAAHTAHRPSSRAPARPTTGRVRGQRRNTTGVVGRKGRMISLSPAEQEATENAIMHQTMAQALRRASAIAKAAGNRRNSAFQ